MLILTGSDVLLYMCVCNTSNQYQIEISTSVVWGEKQSDVDIPYSAIY